MFNLISRLWPAKGRHRRTDVLGADGKPWSPKAELEAAEASAEPEETPEEAAVREAEEIVDHWAAEYARFEAEVRAWFDDLPSIKNDPIAAVRFNEERERLARKASVEAAGQADVKTGEYPLVREAAMAA